MVTEYYSPMDSYLTPEQIRHERESSIKIVEKYRFLSPIGRFGMYFCSLVFFGGATFFALKQRRLTTDLVLSVASGLTLKGADAYNQVIIFKLSLSS